MDTGERQTFSVAAVIPAYNVQEYVGRAIESVLGQSRAADEIIVVDDGSTDGTAEVVRAFGDKVTFIQQENAGASVARNAGIKAAESEWIAFLDADDEWLSDKLLMQVEYLQGHEELMWAGGNFFIRSGEESGLQKVSVEYDAWQSYAADKDYIENYFDAYVRDICILTSTVVAKKSLLEDVGLFRVGQMWAQDTDLFRRIAYREPAVGYVVEPVAVYSHELPTSITVLNKGRIAQRCDLIERHLKAAAAAGMAESFRPCAEKIVARWLRGYTSGQRVDVSQMLDQFGELLPRNMRTEMRIRMSFPRLAEVLFGLYFNVKNRIRSGKG
jgi:glycosyltransferase involved in cell wall biosynthesis